MSDDSANDMAPPADTLQKFLESDLKITLGGKRKRKPKMTAKKRDQPTTDPFFLPPHHGDDEVAELVESNDEQCTDSMESIVFNNDQPVKRSRTTKSSMRTQADFELPEDLQNASQWRIEEWRLSQVCNSSVD